MRSKQMRDEEEDKSALRPTEGQSDPNLCHCLLHLLQPQAVLSLFSSHHFLPLCLFPVNSVCTQPVFLSSSSSPCSAEVMVNVSLCGLNPRLFNKSYVLDDSGANRSSVCCFSGFYI